MSVLVTGAAGFIGSNLVRRLRERWPDQRVISLDALTYAGSLSNLRDLEDDAGHIFREGDIRDETLVASIFEEYSVTRVIHLAAESHVDRSIVGPMRFVETNVVGTVVLLNAALGFWEGDDVRFLHVSTDEVFGDLGSEGQFTEESRYQPSSPYSASKAASDHLVRAWHRTYGMPAMIVNCTNNYGPFQFPEKLIPLTITRARAGSPVPVYGDGTNVRDWLYVVDHCDALLSALEKGVAGETYGIGGESVVENLTLVGKVLDEVDRQLGRTVGSGRESIRFVDDRPGHDHRYAMDITKAGRELGWRPSVSLDEGIERTVAWYLSNDEWVREVESESSHSFADSWYQTRGGTQRGMS